MYKNIFISIFPKLQIPLLVLSQNLMKITIFK